MEVGQHGVDDAEGEARPDEEVGLAAEHAVGAGVRSGAREMLERAHGGRPHGHDPASPSRAAAIRRQAAPSTSKRSACRRLASRRSSLQRTERPEPHVQGDRLDADAGGGEGGVGRRGEVQTGGRCRRRPDGARVQRLIALAVFEIGVDVRRQRGPPHLLQQVEHRARRRGGEHPAAVAQRIVAAHASTPRPAPRSPGSRPGADGRGAGLPSAPPPAGGEWAQKERLDAAARRTAEEGAGREHAGVVAHEHVARREERGKIA